MTPLLAVLALACVAWFGTRLEWLSPFFGVILPYGAVIVFLCGIIWRVLSLARTPVPFNITTTCGQQYSLPWIRSNRLGNPHTWWGVTGRVMLEALFFRSLLSNVSHEWVDGDDKNAPRLVYKASLGLWIGAMIFHYSLLVVLLHHARFFLEPLPRWLNGVERMDSFFRVGSVAFFISGLALLSAALFLLLRRLCTPWLRYLSLPADFLPLYLLLGIALSGGLMRYTPLRTDIPAVKNFCLSLARLHPAGLSGIGPLFHVHLTLVCVFFVYLPFSKLAHMISLPFSPTRNLLGAARMAHHENPWNYSVKVHTYEEYENEYRDKMKAAGIPLEKEAP
jgi:nitrate reductase gamma subunit